MVWHLVLYDLRSWSDLSSSQELDMAATEVNYNF